MDQRILSIIGFAHVNWFLIHCHMERARKVWEQSYSWRQRSRTNAWTNEEQGRFPTSRSPIYRCETAGGKTKSAHHKTFSSNRRKSTIGTSMETMGMEQLVTIFFLLFNLVDATGMARMARIIYVLSHWRKNNRHLFKEFRLQAIAIPLYATKCVNSTPHRADLSRATHNFSRVHVAQVLEPSTGQDRWVVLLASFKRHSFSFMFHRTFLDPQLSPHFSFVSYTCTWFVYFSFVALSFGESIHCHSARRVVLWPTGWTISSPRFWALVSHRSQQRIHSS